MRQPHLVLRTATKELDDFSRHTLLENKCLGQTSTNDPQQSLVKTEDTDDVSRCLLKDPRKRFMI